MSPRTLKWWCCAMLLVAIASGPQRADAARVLKQRFGWTALDFAFPSDEVRQRALLTGAFIPQNALPVGIETWNDKMFVTVPRWREGIPATLTSISLLSNLESPLLEPYPDWATNKQGDCASGLTTVYRIKVDECERLWVLDTGTVGIGNTTRQVCPYALNVFDLRTNTRLRRYELRPQDTNSRTFIANIAVDIGKTCEDTMAYMSDELGYGLLVYSWEQNKSWRFEHSFFMPDPLKADFNIAGMNFQWGEEGVFGLAISPMLTDGYRNLYFSPLASAREFSVSTKILRDESKVANSYHDFKVLEERKSLGHVTSKVMNEYGLMLFNSVDRNGVGCWHSTLPYHEQTQAIVDRDDVGLVFPSDIKIDRNGVAWVISDRMSVFLLANLDYTDVNFRIYSAPVKDLVRGTVCDIVTPHERSKLYYQTAAYNTQPTSSNVWWPRYYY